MLERIEKGAVFMKIYKLDPNPSDLTGGNKVENLLIACLNECNDEKLVQITDKLMNVSGGKLNKVLSYWRNWKLIGQADVVFTNTADRRACFFLHFLKAKKPNIIIVTTHHHFAYLQYKKLSFKRAFVRFYENNIIKNSDILVIPGEYPYALTQKLYPQKLSFFTGVPILKREIKISQRFKGELVFVGSIEPRKGLHFLIEALGKVKEDFHLSIAGSFVGHEEYYEKLINLAKINHIQNKISFLGRISDEEKEALLNKAYTFVFPTQNEGCCNAIVEAIACGCPIISSDRAFNADICDHTNSLLVDPDNVDEIRNAILRVKEDNNLRQSLGEGSLRKSKELTLNARARRILTFMNL